MKRLTLCLALVLFSGNTVNAQETISLKVDYNGFLNLSQELVKYRESRLIDIETFNAFSREENTMILDTRSKKAFDEIHIEGAVHLNFSDFTTESLAEILGDKNRRILIYCNNNFESPLKALMSKRTPLALNIPTFINLYGYGYKNIYELDAYLDQEDQRVRFVGTKITHQ